MIWVNHLVGDDEWAQITIEGHVFDLTIDDLRWIRDMCIEPAITKLEEHQ